MEIDGEEKIGDQEREEEQDDDEERNSDDEANRGDEVAEVPVENPFLDSFYGLSVTDPKERSQAAQTMLQHCLLGSTANPKDAAYALRRLLNGLCSGRAAARQGNASALASFLKVAFQLEKMDEIRSEALASNKSIGEGERSSDLMYVRDRLLAATDSTTIPGKKKGSEERDYQFGRLFGILGVVRSHILLPYGDEDSSDIREVASAMISDLVELFWLKRWMREPAAHGITTMLKLYFDHSEESRKIGRELVEGVIIPKLLLVTQEQTEVEMSDRQSCLGNYCAEQIGVAAYIQSHPQLQDLPFPLDQAIVSSLTLPLIGQALSETSVVVQPRTHFVWDTFWCLLTEPQDDGSTPANSRKGLKSGSTRNLREKVPLTDESALDVIGATINIVVKEKLLRMDKDTTTAKATHERRSLALCIVKALSGVPFVSSLSGPTQIYMDGDAIEHVLLTPEIVQTLFLNVICAGHQKQHASHLLKPLALGILGELAEATVATGGSRQLSFAKAFLNSSVRFDSRTKTSTVSNLLGFSSGRVPTEVDFSLWNEYLTYLETTFLQLCNKPNDQDSSTEANGYAELLYSAAKNVLRAGIDDQTTDVDKKVIEYKERSVKRILSFFMSTAFFDCSKLKHPTTATTKKKKKGKQTMSAHPVLKSAVKVKENIKFGDNIPYPVRAVVASRFFSLAADFAIVISRESKDGGKSKIEKDSNTLRVLADLCDSWHQLESNGANLFQAEEDKARDKKDVCDPERIVNELRERVTDVERAMKTNPDDSLKQSQKRCATGIAILAMTLHLHRLSCGTDDTIEEDPDADEEDDEEEISNTLDGLKEVAEDFLSGKESDSNPLLGLAEMCANILSSPLGSGNMGRAASPKLVREAVKYAWLGGLRQSALLSTEEKNFLDSSVINVLMEAIGASEGEKNVDEDETDEESEEEGSEEEEENDEDGRVFSKAAMILEDTDDLETEGHNPLSEELDSDVEIDPSKLQTMLEEESDVDVDENVLEHHEGADAALAKLIKLKQDARKAGQQARENIEVSNQLRCTFLLEILLGRPDAWNRLFRSNILEMVVPFLRHRKRVGTLVQKALESGGKNGIGEKKALLDRLSVLIKQKLCKLRLLSMPFATPIGIVPATELLKQIINEAKKAKDNEQMSCCSTCLVFVVRSMPSSPEAVSVISDEYGQIVREWATRRSRGASLLDDFISHMPTMAQATLVTSLNEAAREARSPFLKVEAFRLLALLFAVKTDPASSAVDRLAHEKIRKSQEYLLQTFQHTLQDEEMRKPKRVRIVLKALEKVLPCLTGPLSLEALTSLRTTQEKIETLTGKQPDSKLSGLIKERLVELQTEVATSNLQHSTTEKTPEPSSESRKSKKKKKKKKR